MPFAAKGLFGANFLAGVIFQQAGRIGKGAVNTTFENVDTVFVGDHQINRGVPRVKQDKGRCVISRGTALGGCHNHKSLKKVNTREASE